MRKYLKITCGICAAVLLVLSMYKHYSLNQDPNSYELMVFIACVLPLYSKD